MIHLKVVLLLLLSLSIAHCKEKAETNPDARDSDSKQNTDTSAEDECAEPAIELDDSSIARSFQDHFDVGVGIDGNIYNNENPMAVALVSQHFNRVRPRNAMKWYTIQPSEGEFDWKDADAFIEFGEAHNMLIHGHVLVWPYQMPDWVFVDSDGTPVDRELLLERLETHVRALAERYGDRIDYLNVVKSAIAEDGMFDNSPWYKIIGTDFVEQAFIIADRHFPNTQLVYTDEVFENEARRRGVINLVSGLLDKGIRIDAVGIIGQLRLTTFDIEHVRETLDMFRKLNIDLMINELELDVLPKDKHEIDLSGLTSAEEIDAALDPYVDCLPNSVDKIFSQAWAKLYRAFVENSDIIQGTSIGALSDGESWLNESPIPERTNYPLLFNRNLTPKKAIVGILEQAEYK